MKDIPEKSIQDTHKLVYIANENKDKGLGEISQMFKMPIIDFNVAAWLSQDEGFLEVDKKTGEFEIKKTPEKWNFGESVDRLINSIPYIFKKINEQEDDLEENYFKNWTQGYPDHDVEIALTYLKNIEVIASYELTDVDDSGGEKNITKYTFYTLHENRHNKWGKKQFKREKQVK